MLHQAAPQHRAAVKSVGRSCIHLLRPLQGLGHPSPPYSFLSLSCTPPPRNVRRQCYGAMRGHRQRCRQQGIQMAGHRGRAHGGARSGGNKLGPIVLPPTWHPSVKAGFAEEVLLRWDGQPLPGSIPGPPGIRRDTLLRVDAAGLGG
eukprot:gene22413-biopygen14773